MNHYEILLFIMFSPWAWVGLASLLAVFVYANIRFYVTSTVHQLQIRSAGKDPERIRETLTYLKRLRLKHKPEFWCVMATVSGILVILAVGIPLLCTFGIRC